MNVVTVFYCHEPLVSSSGRTGSIDIKVKEKGVIAGAQGSREVQVQSKTLCRKYTSIRYRQENMQKAQTDVKMGWSKCGCWKEVVAWRYHCIGRVFPVGLQGTISPKQCFL